MRRSRRERSYRVRKRVERCFLGLCFLVFFAPSLTRPEPKTYWHITIKANIDGTSAEEWLWATMVEMPREKAFPDEAAAARALGGALEGTVLAQVRAAAWRSAYTYTRDTKCQGRKSNMETSYGQSEADCVFVHGQIIDPPAGRDNPDLDPEFRWGVCNHRVLMEDGRWIRLEDIPHVFVGPIQVEGRESEEMRGGFHVDGIMYNDQIKRVKRCGKSWIEEFDSVFEHFKRESIVDGFSRDTDTRSMFTQRFWSFHTLDVQCVFMVTRSPEREHPHWQRRITE